MLKNYGIIILDIHALPELFKIYVGEDFCVKNYSG